MFSVKTYYWPQDDDDKNLANEAAYQKRQSEVIKVLPMIYLNLIILYSLIDR